VKDDQAAPDDVSELPGLEELLRRNLEGELHRAQLEPGMVVAGKWELTRRLGAGGFGQVWEAWHIELEQTYAIKFLDGEHGGSAGVRARFLAEARLMAEMSSEHLVRVTDYGELADEVPYFVMELVRGPTLRQRLREPLLVSRALEIVEDLLEGLCEVHGRGITHGDIKPENIILSGPGEKVRVLDFGLAQITALATGAAGGTPPYMAPELVLDGAPSTPRSDVYAVGVVLYEMLTGRLPRGHVSMGLEQIRRSWEKKPEPMPVRMRRQDVPEVLGRLVMEALAKDPTARPTGAKAMLDAMRSISGQMAEGLADTVAPERITVGTETEPRPTRKLAIVERRGWMAPVAWASGAVALVVSVALLWPRSDEAQFVEEPPIEQAPAATPRKTETIDGETLAAAKGGILVVAAEEAEADVGAAYEQICAALDGDPPSTKPLHCTRVSGTTAGIDAVIPRADKAGVDDVVLVGRGIVVRSHDRASSSVAQLDGLPLPKEPFARDAAIVLRAVIDPSGSKGAHIPVLERRDVGARWALLSELFRAQRGQEDPDAVVRRADLKEALHDEHTAAQDPAERNKARFYRALAELLWVGEVSCDNKDAALSALSTPGAHVASIRPVALLDRAVCLVEGDAADLDRAERAEVLVEQAIEASGDPCMRLAAVGTISRIDLWRGSDALWKAHEPLLPEESACDPSIQSEALSVRGDALATAKRWCDAAEFHERAYGAMATRSVPLLAWAETDWSCHPDRKAEREALLQALRKGLDAERFTVVERVSIAYMRWWLTNDPVDAQRVVELYREIEEGKPALFEGVGSELEQEICGRADDARCSLRLLASPKRSGDAKRLFTALGLP
jgi:hypothetical protein